MQASKLVPVTGHLSSKSESDTLTKPFCYDVKYKNIFSFKKSKHEGWTYNIEAVMQSDLFSFTAQVSCLSSQCGHANPGVSNSDLKP